MKKIVFIMFFIFGITSAYSQSKWTKENRKNFVTACVPEAKKAMSKKKAKEYCDCALYKVEQSYPDPNQADQISQEFIQKIAEMCLKAANAD